MREKQAIQDQSSGSLVSTQRQRRQVNGAPDVVSVQLQVLFGDWACRRYSLEVWEDWWRLNVDEEEEHEKGVAVRRERSPIRRIDFSERQHRASRVEKVSATIVDESRRIAD